MSSAKYIEVKRRLWRMKSCKQKRNAINLLHGGPLIEKRKLRLIPSRAYSEIKAVIKLIQ